MADVGTYAEMEISVSDGVLSTSLPSFSISVVEPPNRPPTISGSPLATVVIGETYGFGPTGVDPDGDSLTFSIVNKPSWAGFDTATGSLSGTPVLADVGVYADIEISVSDGELVATRPPFTLTVLEAPILVTFTVSGTINNLDGFDLKLKLIETGEEATISNGSTTFAFYVGLEIGSTYTVNVTNQPINNNQVCDVAGGSGTITGVDVSDVVVTCTNIYTIGVTVTGLAGSGLVLQNNSGDDLTITGNGDFGFSSFLFSGDSYNVTVLTQPAAPLQECSIAGGAGTVADADIAGISIDCANLYTISGTVTGLAGNGLMLQNSGGDNLLIAANGAFTFSVALFAGDSYLVTVLTDPANLSQTCGVASGAGTVGTADIGDIAVSCTTNQYSISGTITDLEGSGIQIEVFPGGETLTLSGGTTTFSFAALDDGTPFDVQVVTQPTGPAQECSVTGGAGTLAGGAVAGVSILCLNFHVISGTVAGLTGTGLQLQLNGAETLNISADGAFGFSTTLIDLSPYAVTIPIQPSSPTQICYVYNSTGTLSGTDIVDISVSCSGDVLPLYSTNGTGWNDYVKNDGGDRYHANDLACSTADGPTYDGCVHGGEVRVFDTGSSAVCTGLTASDSLGAFDWVCDDSGATTKFYSAGLADGMYLSDLIDFTTGNWKENAVLLDSGGGPAPATASAIWWTTCPYRKPRPD